MDALPARADVVVIGGGIVGAGIAFHLVEAGVGDVVVVERGEIAGGSSGKPIGGVRAQFSDTLNIQLAARTLAAYDGFGQTPGAEIALDKVGYLFLLRKPRDVARFERSIAIQNEHGIATRLLSPAEAHALCPPADPDAFRAAAFSPSDGHTRPAVAAGAYVDGARRCGARVVTGCDVATTPRSGCPRCAAAPPAARRRWPAWRSVTAGPACTR